MGTGGDKQGLRGTAGTGTDRGVPGSPIPIPAAPGHSRGSAGAARGALGSRSPPLSGHSRGTGPVPAPGRIGGIRPFALNEAEQSPQAVPALGILRIGAGPRLGSCCCHSPPRVFPQEISFPFSRLGDLAQKRTRVGVGGETSAQHIIPSTKSLCTHSQTRSLSSTGISLAGLCNLGQIILAHLTRKCPICRGIVIVA